MMDTPERVERVDLVKLVSVTEDRKMGFAHSQDVAFSVDLTTGEVFDPTARCFDFKLSYRPGTVKDEHVVAIARADLHQHFLDLAEATKPWAMTTEQREAALKA